MIHTPKFPLQLGDRSLFEKSDEIKNIVFFHIRNLVLTYPGEKISDPQYGIGIKRFLFENITSGILNNITDRIESAINTYLSYIDLIRLEVSAPPDSNGINIVIAFEIPDLDIIEEISFDVSNI